MISIKSFITDLFFPFFVLTLTIIAYNFNDKNLNDVSFYLLSFGGFYTIIKGFSKKLAVKQVFLTTDNRLISGQMKAIYPRNKYLQYILYTLGETNIYSDIAYYNQDEIPPLETIQKKVNDELKQSEINISDVFTEHNMYV